MPDPYLEVLKRLDEREHSHMDSADRVRVVKAVFAALVAIAMTGAACIINNFLTLFCIAGVVGFIVFLICSKR